MSYIDEKTGKRYVTKKSYERTLEVRPEEQLCRKCNHQVILITYETIKGLRTEWTHGGYGDSAVCKICPVPCDCDKPEPLSNYFNDWNKVIMKS